MDGNACPSGQCRRKSTQGGGTESNNTITTKDVNVEANRAKEEAKYESQSTTIITAEDIAAKQAKSVEDIIFNETGMVRNVDAMGRVSVSIRGAEPRHTLILVDGSPVMGDFDKYSGQGDELQRLGTENVERIEIIKGAASAKYGADAIGGVINVITKKAAKTAGLTVNVEGRRAKGDGDIFPYQNFFIRGDSGQMGKVRVAAWGSRREIMPAYSTETFGGMMQNGTADGSRIRNSLRYYGSIKDIGVAATYDFNDRHSLDFSVDKVSEDLERYVKHSNAASEPQQHFKRSADRKTYRLNYKGNNGGSTDWTVSADYSKMNEDDITLSSYYGYSKYEGKNTLNYVDDLEHEQWNFKASANTQVNDKHLLTYGFGFSKETGEGSRLKNAPQTWTKTIDPWDYDKNLYTKGGTGAPSSTVHDYPLTYDEKGIPEYDQALEWYGGTMPAYTYGDFQTWGGDSERLPSNMPENKRQDLLAFQKELIAQNPNAGADDHTAVLKYYTYYTKEIAEQMGEYASYFQRKYNGKLFQEDKTGRDNQVKMGRADIKKENFFIQDTWQINDNTLFTPIIRLDHSSIFGNHMTFNLGLTHNIHGKANHRFKANVGTGYTEPGMGELYYNWEMYAGSPVGWGEARLGHYMVGNPNLKPEKSVNIDMGLETENGKTSTRWNVFHNKIDDYMTYYFSGKLINFNPAETDNDKAWQWIAPPDMIYSYRNIGKAEITGVEAEINHRFNDHWSAKLGYTYLHAINKSDPDMPRQLLNKPTHKIDIGITYDNKKSGWRASLWGNYYIHMLDSNSISGNGNYLYYTDATGNEPQYAFSDGKHWSYQKKTFGLWNLLIQKAIDKDSTVYFGIDNLFNHRDDDRALQERVYRFGVNLKFGSDGHTVEKSLDKTVGKAVIEERDNVNRLDTDWFIQKPFDTEKAQGVEVIGDYRGRWNSFTGKLKPEARVTSVADIGTAEKNMFEKAGHGFEQRLRLGIDARIGENTNVKILGSASGMSGVDTGYDVSDSKGLNHQRLENVDITQHVNKWDFSVGRLTELMGVTGYWFGKEYDGGRAVWTSGKNQLRLGYGDFSHSTGITDSAYTHVVRKSFYRVPTRDEWLGRAWNENTRIYVDGYETMLDKLEKATTYEERASILNNYLEVIKEHDPQGYNTLTSNTLSVYADTNAWYKVTSVNKKTGAVSQYYSQYQPSKLQFSIIDTLDKDSLHQSVASYIDSTNYMSKLESRKNSSNSRFTTTYEFMGYCTYVGTAPMNSGGSIYGASDSDFKLLDTNSEAAREKAKELIIQGLWNGTAYGTLTFTRDLQLGNALGEAAASIITKWKPEDDSSLPLTFLPDRILVENGTVLVQDIIPSIERAFFAQYKHQFGNTFGVQAWYLRSVNDDTHSMAYANGSRNDVYSYDKLASVIGIGAKWRLGSKTTISYDWGQNRTDFGRMMNGHTLYNHTAGTSDFDITGRAKGGTPRFWVARIDIGRADTDVPGSWNAFADYKYFQHGSFFGGNGTEALPDRYLDGIKSFTIGGGYVPAKNLLIEAFYTFGAKGIGKRDTLYGAESFTLGDYTRIQATYKF